MDSKRLAKQLRSGNLLIGKPISLVNQGIYSNGYTYILAQGISYMEQGVETELKPVRITPEFLTNSCGFTDSIWQALKLPPRYNSDGMNEFLKYNNGCLFLEQIGDQGETDYSIHKHIEEFEKEHPTEDATTISFIRKHNEVILTMKLQYVHELQNFYFSICEVEMEVTNL